MTPDNRKLEAPRIGDKPTGGRDSERAADATYPTRSDVRLRPVSVEQMTRVFKWSRSKGSTRLVLLAIADVANDDGEASAYPRSQKVLAAKANCNGATVARAVQALVEMGEVEVTRKGDGRKPSNYRLTVDPPEGTQIVTPQSTDPGGATDVPRGDEMRTQGARDVTPINPSLSVPGPSSSVAEPKPPKGHKYTAKFLRFHAAYPNKAGKLASSRKYAEHEPVVGEQFLLDRAAAWADYWQAKGTAIDYIPYPATWLHQGQYESLPPTIDTRSEKQRRYDAIEAKFLAEANGQLLDVSAVETHTITQPEENTR